MTQQFHTIDRFRLEVEDDPTGLVNLAQNPNGEFGTWAYVTPVPNTAVSIDGIWKTLKFATTVAQAAHWKTELIPMTAGHHVAARFDALAATSAAVTVRCRYEFYGADRALLSSGAQSGAFAGDFSAKNVPLMQAPAGTAYVALRWDLYRSGGTPAAGDQFVFSGVTVCTAPVSSALGGSRRNLVKNPSFETNMAGWDGAATRVVGGTVGGHCGRIEGFVRTGQVLGFGATPDAYVAVTAGRFYTATAQLRASGPTTRLHMSWLSANALLEEYTHTLTHAAGTWAQHATTFTAPAGATTLQIAFSCPGVIGTHYLEVDAVMVDMSSMVGDYFDGSTPALEGWTHSWDGTPHASTSTAITSTLQYAQPIQYRDVTSPTIEASIDRETLNLGVLNATIRDALLDPSRDDLIRPGRRARAMALATDGTWQPLMGGTLATANVSYDYKDPAVPDDMRAKIEVSIHDPQAGLANQERPQGVATIPELAFILEGAGIPWSINGSGNQVPAATVVTESPGQTAIDQIVMTRDSKLGLAWIDRRGIVQIWDRAALPAAPVATLTEAEYTEAPPTWSSADCINSVAVNIRRFGTGETVEVPRGPYRDEASIRRWGARSATFTVQGIADTDSAAKAHADQILAANATPQLRIDTVTYAITTTAGFDLAGHATAFRDLCDLVRVKNALAGFDRNLRVTSVKHKITAEKWLVTLGFGEPSSVETPTVVPPVQQSASYYAQKAGGGTYNTNASGLTTVTHDLGRVPVHASVSLATAAFTAAVTAKTATTMTVHVVNSTTGANYAGGISMTYFVV